MGIKKSLYLDNNGSAPHCEDVCESGLNNPSIYALVDQG
jgi:hypothetical protein